LILPAARQPGEEVDEKKRRSETTARKATSSLSKLTTSNAVSIGKEGIMKHARRITAGVVLAVVLAALPGLAAEAKKVNVNSADASQLALLPRVGPATAQRIIEYRKQNGPFKKAEDLMLVRGIGEKTFELLKPYVATSGETTLKEKVRASRSGSGQESR